MQGQRPPAGASPSCEGKNDVLEGPPSQSRRAASDERTGTAPKIKYLVPLINRGVLLHITLV